MNKTFMAQRNAKCDDKMRTNFRELADIQIFSSEYPMTEIGHYGGMIDKSSSCASVSEDQQVRVEFH